MAKNEKPANTKLELVTAVPGSTLSNPFITALTVSELPDESSLEVLSMPNLVKPNDVEIGLTVSGQVMELVQNFTGCDSMRESLSLRLKHSSGKEFLFPITGSIKKGMGKLLTFEDVTEKDSKGKPVTWAKATLQDDVIGRTMYFTRLPDGKAKKFGGKQMFLFDVRITKA